MSFFFFSDASAKESTEIKVFDPNLKMSDQEMFDLLKEVDLESHGYKKEETAKLVSQPESEKHSTRNRFFSIRKLTARDWGKSTKN